MDNRTCPVCGSFMRHGLKNWHWYCKSCRYETSDLVPVINDVDAHKNLDESMRETGLQSLRIENFSKLLEVIRKEIKSDGRILEVGCGHGWFLEAAARFSILGLEPDRVVGTATAQRGLPVRLGFFPEALEASEQFDAIVFNDVFEHMPDIKNTLISCHKHLYPVTDGGGILVLNLPSSSGVFYKISRWLCSVGMDSYFNRMWQKGMPSPHLHYFNKKNLAILLRAHDFYIVHQGVLSSVKLKGLWARILCGQQKKNYIYSLLTYVATMLFLPMFTIFSKDIMYVVVRRNII